MTEMNILSMEREMGRYTRVEDFDKNLFASVKQYLVENPARVLMSFSYDHFGEVRSYKFYAKNETEIILRNVDFHGSIVPYDLESILSVRKRA
jgi:hypothetical protein